METLYGIMVYACIGIAAVFIGHLTHKIITYNPTKNRRFDLNEEVSGLTIIFLVALGAKWPPAYAFIVLTAISTIAMRFIHSARPTE